MDIKIHSVKPQSKLGGDELFNLTALYAGCHDMEHG